MVLLRLLGRLTLGTGQPNHRALFCVDTDGGRKATAVRITLTGLGREEAAVLAPRTVVKTTPRLRRRRRGKIDPEVGASVRDQRQIVDAIRIHICNREI